MAPNATDQHSKTPHGGRHRPEEDTHKAAEMSARGSKVADVGEAKEDGRHGRQPTGRQPTASTGLLQTAVLPRAAAAAVVHAAGDVAPDIASQAEYEAPLQHSHAAGAASALQKAVGSPGAASASQQAAGQAAQRAEERLKALVLGLDYSEKNWYYVDPQVRCNAGLMQSCAAPRLV